MKSLTIRLSDIDPDTINVVATPEDDGVTVRINCGEERQDKAPAFPPKPQFTFDNFIPLESNRFALAAAKAVVAKPGADYSPLTIFGEVGTGKTHLLHAIGNGILNVNPETKVYCCDAPLFVDRLLRAIRHHDLSAFRCRLHAADVLLLDTLQFLAGKGRSQEELIDLLNALIETRKQVVVTINEHPKNVRHLDDRLKSILHGGLLADIETLGAKDRRTFIEQESQRLGLLQLSPEIVEFVADHFLLQTCPRAVKGALIKLKAQADLNGMDLTLNQVRSVLQVHLNDPCPEL